MLPNQDTIVAIATAPGRGGVGIVRLSGPQARPIAERLLQKPRPLQPRHAHFAVFVEADGTVIDEGLVISFPGPNSFTGEDVVELQGHGGPVLLDLLVQTCVRHGARPARPGEFSQRAFLNDRLDLAQAEAIADLIEARTQDAARAAVRSLQGAFSQEVNRMVEALIHLRMYVEAAIDFPEEEIDFLSDGKVQQDLISLIDHVEQVLKEARRGTLLQEGLTLVIAGRPNAGKSSLLNALAGEDLAIVTDIAGTTRDVLRETIHLDGLPIRIIDTAGLRESTDPVEQEGIRRARKAMEQADRLLLVTDSTTLPPNGVPGPKQLDALRRQHDLPDLPVSHVLNKCDLSGWSAGTLGTEVIGVSARSGAGLEALREHLKQVAGYQQGERSPFSARRRHLTALEHCLQALQEGQAQLDTFRAGELLAEHLRHAQQALEEITGTFTSDDLLGRIFGSFCIGK